MNKAARTAPKRRRVAVRGYIVVPDGYAAGRIKTAHYKHRCVSYVRVPSYALGAYIRKGAGRPLLTPALSTSPDIPVTDTIERHLNTVEKIVTGAEERFGTSSLSGQWWKDLERFLVFT